MAISALFGTSAVVVGLSISFHAGTAGGATMAGLSVAQFFVVLATTEVAALVSNQRQRSAAVGRTG